MTVRVLTLLMLLLGAAHPQAPSQSPSQTPSQTNDELNRFVSAQFGSSFTPTPPFNQKSVVLLTGDFDGDGQEDAVIVATTKEPFANAVGLKYKVVDPYDTYFGYGNPKITSGFSAHDDRARVLLVALAWRSAAPKAKFVILNVPFDRLAVETMSLKGKQRTVISAIEEDIMRSYLFWD